MKNKLSQSEQFWFDAILNLNFCRKGRLGRSRKCLILSRVSNVQHFVDFFEVLGCVQLLPELAVEALELQVSGNHAQGASEKVPLVVAENFRFPLTGSSGRHRSQEGLELGPDFFGVSFLGQLPELGHQPEAVLGG